MNYPYNLTEDQIVLDPSSHRMLELGTVSMKDLMDDLVANYTDEEIQRITWSLGVLCNSPACTQWLDAFPEREMSDWALMALDTAMTWERG